MKHLEPRKKKSEVAKEVAVREGTVGVIVADPQLPAARKALAQIPYLELGQASTTEANASLHSIASKSSGSVPSATP